MTLGSACRSECLRMCMSECRPVSRSKYTQVCRAECRCGCTLECSQVCTSHCRQVCTRSRTQLSVFIRRPKSAAAPEDLVEGQQVSFRSRLSEAPVTHALGAADQVRPRSASDQTSEPQPSEEDLLRTFTERALRTQRPQPELPQRQLPESVQPRIPAHPEQADEELYGTVKFWGAEMKSGIIQIDDNNRYQFAEAAIIRGAAHEGASAKFRAVAAPDGALPHAVDVELA